MFRWDGRSLALLLLVGGVGCGGGGTSPGPTIVAEGLVPPDRETILTANDGKGPTMTFPVGSVGQPVVVTVTVAPTDPPSGALTKVYKFEPAGTTFQKPVEVKFPVTVGAASVYWTKAGGKSGYDSLPTRMAGGYAIASVNHFSEGYVGVPCTEGSACTPSNVCHVGAQVCSSGTFVCSDTSTNVQDGTDCGNGNACKAGACVPRAVSRTVGGTVSGLAGSGLVLRNNGLDDLAVSVNASFSFAAPVAEGGSYAVTVLTQPTSPAR
jgi:hypothetical protein